MFLHMLIQRALRAEGSDARRMRTNKSFNPRMHHEKMINHFLMLFAINAANEAKAFPFITFKVRQKMRPECVVD